MQENAITQGMKGVWSSRDMWSMGGVRRSVGGQSEDKKGEIAACASACSRGVFLHDSTRRYHALLGDEKRELLPLIDVQLPQHYGPDSSVLDSTRERSKAFLSALRCLHRLRAVLDSV